MNEMTVAAIILDMIVVYLLLIGTVKLYRGRFEFSRILIAAIIVGIHSYAVVSGMLPSTDQYTTRIVALTLAGFLAFGCNKDGIMEITLFFLLNAAVKGTLNGHYISSAFHRFVVAVMITSLCFILRKNGRIEKTYVRVKISFGGKSVCVDALLDTGNDLKDIVTGVPVLVIGPDVAHDLTGLKQQELFSPLDTLEKRLITGLRLIPYSSVGNSQGLMLGIKPAETTVDGIPADLVVAMAPEGLGIYEALIGGDRDTWHHKSTSKKTFIRREVAPLHRWIGYTSLAVKG